MAIGMGMIMEKAFFNRIPKKLPGQINLKAYKTPEVSTAFWHRLECNSALTSSNQL